MSLTTISQKLQDYRKSFHTCSELMPKKIHLESLVKQLPKSNLKTYFAKTPYSRRKISFYSNIQKYLNDDMNNTVCLDIAKTLGDILDIYKVKIAHIHSLNSDLEDILSEIDLEQEQREEMIEYFRNQD